MTWPQIVFGWPAIIASLAAFAAAFTTGRSWLGFLGLALAVPFLWYASHSPTGEWFSPALFLALLGAAVLLRQGRRRAAMVCLSPFVLVIAIMATVVLSQ
jgi:hypothetical protein